MGGVSSVRGAREDRGRTGRTGPSWVRGKKPLGLTTACRPTMCTAWSTSIFAGTSAATGMVRTTAWPASRSILRRTAGCTVILGFRESYDGERVLATRALVFRRATTKTSQQPRDVTTRTVTRARVNENPDTWSQSLTRFTLETTTTLTQCFFATASPHANSSRVLRATRPPRAHAASRP